MHEIVVTGETKPGDVMDRPFVAVPFATWETTKAAAAQVSDLTAKLQQERDLSAKITQEFQDYMRENRVLTQQKKAGTV